MHPKSDELKPHPLFSLYRDRQRPSPDHELNDCVSDIAFQSGRSIGDFLFSVIAYLFNWANDGVFRQMTPFALRLFQLEDPRFCPCDIHTAGNQILWKPLRMSRVARRRITGRPWGQVVGDEVTSNRSISQRIFSGASGIFTLIAA
jgi:hypothetical protein